MVLKDNGLDSSVLVSLISASGASGMPTVIRSNIQSMSLPIVSFTTYGSLALCLVYEQHFHPLVTISSVV